MPYNKASKYKKPKLLELKEGIDKSVIIVIYFNTLGVLIEYIGRKITHNTGI